MAKSESLLEQTDRQMQEAIKRATEISAAVVSYHVERARRAANRALMPSEHSYMVTVQPKEDPRIPAIIAALKEAGLIEGVDVIEYKPCTYSGVVGHPYPALREWAERKAGNG